MHQQLPPDTINNPCANQQRRGGLSEQTALECSSSTAGRYFVSQPESAPPHHAAPLRQSGTSASHWRLPSKLAARDGTADGRAAERGDPRRRFQIPEYQRTAVAANTSTFAGSGPLIQGSGTLAADEFGGRGLVPTLARTAVHSALQFGSLHSPIDVPRRTIQFF